MPKCPSKTQNRQCWKQGLPNPSKGRPDFLKQQLDGQEYIYMIGGKRCWLSEFQDWDIYMIGGERCWLSEFQDGVHDPALLCFYCHMSRRRQKKSIGRQPYFLVWGPLTPPPPQYPPPSAPTQTKRVPFCSFWNSASICILINT